MSLFIYLLFTLDSLFNSVKLLSMRVAAFFVKHLKKSFAELAVISNFHHRSLIDGLKSESFDTKLNALTSQPRIHKAAACLDPRLAVLRKETLNSQWHLNRFTSRVHTIWPTNRTKRNQSTNKPGSFWFVAPKGSQTSPTV